MAENGSGPDNQESFTLAQRTLAGSRYIIAVAAFGALLASMTLLLYGVGVVIVTIKDLLMDLHFDEKGAKSLSLTFIQLVDSFLLGTVIYIIAIGLYELFVDDNLPTPKWMHITTLDDLKEKLIGVVIVLMGVTFLAAAINWEGDTSIIYLGAANALVIFSLVFATKLITVRKSDSNPKP